jgi:NADPH:quinone reductase-like Zn-dependent oxidoreductase
MNEYSVYGEAAIVPARWIVDRPERVDAVTGAAVWMAYLTGYGGLVAAGGPRAGDIVVLTAASSSVGVAGIQIAHRVGATPIAATRTAAKRNKLLAAGATAVIVTDEEDVAEGILRATDGRGADLAFDAVAGPGVADLARGLVRGGRIVVYGALSAGSIELPSLTILGTGLTLRGYGVTSETLPDGSALRPAMAFVTSGLTSGAIRPVIDRVFDGLDEMSAAHSYLESNAQVGKVVVRVR